MPCRRSSSRQQATASLSLTRRCVEHLNSAKASSQPLELILAELGLLDVFAADGHLPSFGNESSWGSPDVHRTDFIRSPLRTRLAPRSAQIRRDAPQLGRPAGALVHAAVMAPGVPRRRRRHVVPRRGRPEWDHPHTEPLAGGCDRTEQLRSRIAWACGGSARTDYWRSRRFSGPDGRRPGFPELRRAVEDGWWYTGEFSHPAYRTVVFFTDAGLEAANAARTRRGFVAAFSTTLHVSTRLAAFDYEIAEVPHATDASSVATRTTSAGPAGWRSAMRPCRSTHYHRREYSRPCTGPCKAARALIEELESNGSSLADTKTHCSRSTDTTQPTACSPTVKNDVGPAVLSGSLVTGSPGRPAHSRWTRSTQGSTGLRAFAHDQTPALRTTYIASMGSSTSIVPSTRCTGTRRLAFPLISSSVAEVSFAFRTVI